ncbi:hypothetical protein MRA01_49040 [Methylobacterium radiotolerans]|nr:hypothetical protein MRA01_49040 [Methylobacterium radiotolerans]
MIGAHPVLAPPQRESGGSSGRHWGEASFAPARNGTYALPTAIAPDEHWAPAYMLDGAYAVRAQETARQQFAKAGFRLIRLLNQALR